MLTKNVNRLQQSNGDAGRRGSYRRAQMKDGVGRGGRCCRARHQITPSLAQNAALNHFHGTYHHGATNKAPLETQEET